MEIEYLKRFVVVGETLNFRKAADILFISQPTLSHSISNIEQYFGTPLLIRDTRSVSLTPEGEAFLPVAREIVEKFEDAARTIFYDTSSDSGTLRMAYVGPSLDNTITPWLKEFHRLYPDANIELSHYNGLEIKEAFAKHTVQIAFMYEENVKDIQNIRYETIESERYRLLVNKNHPFAARKSVTLEEIAQENLIMWDRQKTMFLYDKILSLFESRSLKPNIYKLSAHPSETYRMVSIGVGVAIMSYSPLRDYGSYDMKFLDIEGVNETHNRVMAYCADLPAITRYFRKIVKDNPLSSISN